MVRSRVALVSALLVLSLSSCARHSPAPVVAMPEPAPAPVPMPQPPRGSAANLAIPQRLPDGSFPTPNRGLSSPAAVWHLRAALNVAALGCDDPQRSVSGAYNRMLAAQKKGFADAHRTLAREYPSTDAFDTAMTRLYNYFSQPPAQPGFCAAARATLSEAEAVPPAEFAAFAAGALPRLDRPFVDFYAAYDSYRVELAAWQGGNRTAPRLGYDTAVFLASDEVTWGNRDRRFAAR